MIVTAMLAWFNEDPEQLRRAVLSAATLVDRVVAVDGGWDLYPGAAESSPPEQAEAIMAAAAEAGIVAEVHPGRRWTGQVEKRHHMLQLAAEGSDWVMPLDADWIIRGDRETIRAELQDTRCDAMIVEFFTPLNNDANLFKVAATDWHVELAGRSMHEPLIWRALEDMRVEAYHWYYSGVKNGQRVTLWGDQQDYPKARTGVLQAYMVIDHMCFFRDERTIEANRVYCRDRAKHVQVHGQEP